jgi:hypothetical protein
VFHRSTSNSYVSLSSPEKRFEHFFEKLQFDELPVSLYRQDFKVWNFSKQNQKQNYQDIKLQRRWFIFY